MSAASFLGIAGMVAKSGACLVSRQRYRSKQ